jgi:hypothetical protein
MAPHISPSPESLGELLANTLAIAMIVAFVVVLFLV